MTNSNTNQSTKKSKSSIKTMLIYAGIVFLFLSITLLIAKQISNQKNTNTQSQEAQKEDKNQTNDSLQEAQTQQTTNRTQDNAKQYSITVWKYDSKTQQNVELTKHYAFTIPANCKVVTNTNKELNQKDKLFQYSTFYVVCNNENAVEISFSPTQGIGVYKTISTIKTPYFSTVYKITNLYNQSDEFYYSTLKEDISKCSSFYTQKEKDENIFCGYKAITKSDDIYAIIKCTHNYEDLCDSVVNTWHLE